MNIPYILIAIIALAIIALLLVIKAKRAGKQLQVSTLTPIAMILIIGGIVLSDRFLSYGLIAAGVIIVVVDAIRLRRKAKNSKL